MELGFYEWQLLVLASLCAVSLGVERHVATSSGWKESAEDRLENGTRVGSGVLSALTRKYLLVYAIVMGPFLSSFAAFFSPLCRRGLAPGPLCIFAVQGSICLSREDGRRFLRDRFPLSCYCSTCGRRMGRPTVRLSFI